MTKSVDIKSINYYCRTNIKGKNFTLNDMFVLCDHTLTLVYISIKQEMYM